MGETLITRYFWQMERLILKERETFLYYYSLFTYLESKLIKNYFVYFSWENHNKLIEIEKKYQFLQAKQNIKMHKNIFFNQINFKLYQIYYFYWEF